MAAVFCLHCLTCLRARSSKVKNPTDKLVLRLVFFDPMFCHATLNRHRRFGNLAHILGVLEWGALSLGMLRMGMPGGLVIKGL